MTGQVCQFQFGRRTSPRELETTFMLAVLAVQSLHGRTRVWLKRNGFRLEARARRCTIDISTRVGRDMARIFAGYAKVIHGKHAVRIWRGKQPRGQAASERGATGRGCAR